MTQVQVKAEPQTQQLLQQMKASGAPPLHQMSVGDARDGLKALTLELDLPRTEVGRRAVIGIPGRAGDIEARIYSPVAEKGKSPLLLLFHGGGFALGDLDTHENMARYFCQRAGVTVVSVGYRLAPEHRFPAAIDDAYDALCWVAENADEIGGDRSRIAVAGDSAGGAIAAALCQLTGRLQGPPVIFQALLYPCLTLQMDTDYPSRRLFDGGDYFLSMGDIAWINGLYFNHPEREVTDLRAAPILAEDLDALPPALVITAGLDILRDEGRHYAERLQAAGVKTQYKCYTGTIHGFMSFAGALDVGKEALEFVAGAVREALHESGSA